MGKTSYIEDFEKWKEEFSFYTDIKIRFSETDMFGHVNNVSPFIYFEQGRIEFLAEKGLTASDSTILVVADLQCDYLHPLYFGDTLRLYVKANSVGNSSIDIHYLGVNGDGKDCLIGRGNLVSVDPVSGKPVPIPEETREQILS